MYNLFVTLQSKVPVVQRFQSTGLSPEEGAVLIVFYQILVYSNVHFFEYFLTF